MKPKYLHTLLGCLLALLLCSPGWAAPANPPQPGTINYVEGQASIGGQSLNAASAGSTTLLAGQVLTTQNGRVEILLTPGVFLRVGNHSTLEMVSPELENTILNLRQGRALVEVDEIHSENNLRVDENGAGVQLLKPGLYDFDAGQGQIRVFDGKALVQTNRQKLEVKKGHQVELNTTAKLKARKFDPAADEDDFYRWASLRSSYLMEANVDAANRYAGGGGWSPTVWSGAGWYWDPWYDAYTFIPGDGLFYSPFGWGFYSPWFVTRAPYLGFFGGYSHHFGPGYGAHRFPGHSGFVFSGRPHLGGNGFLGRGRASGMRGLGNFNGGGFRGSSGFRGGFHGGGGHR